MCGFVLTAFDLNFKEDQYIPILISLKANSRFIFPFFLMQAKILSAASLLLGLSEPPTALPSPKRPAKETLSNVLTRRVLSFSEFTFDWSVPCSINLTTSSSPLTEAELKRLTAEGCIYLLELLERFIHSETVASTSKLDRVDVPIFGVKDMKIINTCAGIIGRWGIAMRVYEGILPSTYRDGATGKFEELGEEVEGLDLVVKRILGIVELGGERRNSGKGQLVQLVLPQLLIPLLGGLVQLGYEKLEEREMYRLSLLGLFQS